ncbi:hypothetical protein NC653_008083 [Populus alba x Populus x berolinensis]|uniref:Uncharacterized protein n=1 Tax=Populus alba x Populus x berolinensis TaxID=444605 RepID=A0AAD6W8M2_9ROSI|nr:hypothetical protein NC653_008083 [Populus alba x Populus x berolinensis]
MLGPTGGRFMSLDHSMDVMRTSLKTTLYFSVVNQGTILAKDDEFPLLVSWTTSLEMDRSSYRLYGSHVKVAWINGG